MNFLRKFIGSSPTDEIASLPKGKLFLTRLPHSPKGSLECLYNDGFICIKKTTRDFYYQLSVCKVYAEGEITDTQEHDFDSEEEEDSSELTNSISNKSKDEWSFIIVPDLWFEFTTKRDGTKALTWVDINGDMGDRFEFTIDDEVKGSEIVAFKVALFKCLYEQKYQRSSGEVDMAELGEFESREVRDEVTIDDVKKDILDYNNAQGVEGEEEFDDAVAVEAEPTLALALAPTGVKQEPFTFISTTTPGKEIFSTFSALFLYENSQFKPLGPVTAKLVEVSSWQYTLQLTSKTILFETVIGSQMNPYIDVDEQSFVFNYVNVKDGSLSSYTWLMRLEDIKLFKNQFIRLLWQTINKKLFGEQSKVDEEYIGESITAMNVDDDEEFLSADDGEEEDEEEEEEEEGKSRTIKVDYDTFSDDNSPPEPESAFNSGLSVGYANDRSYVVRGNNLGVFKTEGRQLQFQTAVNNLTDKLGHQVVPEKLMLQNRDEHMIIKPEADDRLFRMDLTTGKIVEEWNLTNKEGIRDFRSNKKLDQLTNELTFSGISPNSLFRLDPRLPDIVVKDGSKQYKTKNNGFNNIVTTNTGNLAIGSDTGNIRLFDKIGGNAKTLLPTLGDRIESLDVSRDGRWVLATCSDYLLLIDTKIGKGQRNEGQLGFNSSFNADAKPVPRRLKLKPEHHNELLNLMGVKSLNFTKAYFNTSLNKQETHIITSTGNFLIMFNMKNIVKNKEPKYTVKKFGTEITNNEFKFDSNDIILTSKDSVDMSSRNAFRQFENLRI